MTPIRREPVADMRHGGGRLVAIDGDAHDLGAGPRQSRDLPHGRVDIGGVGVGHRLDDDRRAAADPHAPDIDGDGPVARRNPVRDSGFAIDADGFVHVGLLAPCRRSRAAGQAAFTQREGGGDPQWADDSPYSPLPSRSSAASSVASRLAKQKRTTERIGSSA